MAPSAGNALVSLSFQNQPPRAECTERRILLDRNEPSVKIGRTSKRVSHLAPSIYNGWIDSPVISRDHAEIYYDFSDKTIHIKDLDSRHGTYLNHLRLSANNPALMMSGDVVRFGIDIQRENESFPPPCATVDIEFNHDSHDGPAAGTSRNNAFQVPDDSDDSSSDGYSSDDDNQSALDKTIPTLCDLLHLRRYPKLAPRSAGERAGLHPAKRDSESPPTKVNPIIIDDGDSERAEPASDKPVYLTRDSRPHSDGVSGPPAEEQVNSHSGAVAEKPAESIDPKHSAPSTNLKCFSIDDVDNETADVNHGSSRGAPAQRASPNASPVSSSQDLQNELVHSDDDDHGDDEALAEDFEVEEFEIPFDSDKVSQDPLRDDFERGPEFDVESDDHYVNEDGSNEYEVCCMKNSHVSTNICAGPGELQDDFDHPVYDTSIASGTGFAPAYRFTTQEHPRPPPVQSTPIAPATMSTDYRLRLPSILNGPQGVQLPASSQPTVNPARHAPTDSYSLSTTQHTDTPGLERGCIPDKQAFVRWSNMRITHKAMADASETAGAAMSSKPPGPAPEPLPEPAPESAPELAPEPVPEPASETATEPTPQSMPALSPAFESQGQDSAAGISHVESLRPSGVQAAVQTAWSQSGDKFLSSPPQDLLASDMRDSPELDMTSAYQFRQSKLVLQSSQEQSADHTTEALEEEPLTPNFLKRKADDISDLTPAEQANQKTVSSNNQFSGEGLVSPTKEVEDHDSADTMEEPHMPHAISEEIDRPIKKLRRMAEAAGYIALGGAFAFGTLVATSPSFS